MLGEVGLHGSSSILASQAREGRAGKICFTKGSHRQWMTNSDILKLLREGLKKTVKKRFFSFFNPSLREGVK